EWEMRQRLAPILFDDEQHDGLNRCGNPVAPAQRPAKALRKAANKVNNDGEPIHSFQTLLKDLATTTRNMIQPQLPESPTFSKTTPPTPLQQKALLSLAFPLTLPSSCIHKDNLDVFMNKEI
ncbi:MAG: hypothetical protein D6820_18105, partial [Lentisphaerae bacterium]